MINPLFDEEFIQKNIQQFQPVAISSNNVFRFTHDSENYILKMNRFSAGNLSPFWYSIREVFHSDFDSQRDHIAELLSLLVKNPHIPPAELVATSGSLPLPDFQGSGGGPI